jgi:hypothetical protein
LGCFLLGVGENLLGFGARVGNDRGCLSARCIELLVRLVTPRRHLGFELRPQLVVRATDLDADPVELRLSLGDLIAERLDFLFQPRPFLFGAF